KDEVEDSEGDPEDDKRQEKTIGAEARNILWPDHSNGQDKRDRQQTNTRQPVQPFPCCKALIHYSPAPLSRHPGIPKSRQEKRKTERNFSVLREKDSAERTKVRLVHRAQLADEREQWQVHGYDHAADHHAEKYDHDGLESGQQVFHRRVNFFFIEISDLLKHRAHRARLFADSNQLCDPRRKPFRFV